MTLYDDPVFLTEVVMLTALLSAGFYLSYTDLSVRLVPNRYTFGLLLIGIAGQLIMVSLDVTTLSRVVALLLTGLVIALGLMVFGFWAPGDARFFWAVVSALPPTLCPSADPFSFHAPPVALILNTLACNLLVLLLVPFWQRQWQAGESGEGAKPELFRAAVGLAGMAGLTLAFSVIVMERPLSYLEAFAGVVIGYHVMEKLLKVPYWPLVVIPGAMAFLYVGYTTSAWQEYAILMAAAWLVEAGYQYVRRWSSRAYVQLFPVRYLRAGAILRNGLQLAGADGAEHKIEAGRPLSEKQAAIIRSAMGGGSTPGQRAVEVEQAIPFVPVIAGAAALTAFFAGNLVPPLVALVEWLGG